MKKFNKRFLSIFFVFALFFSAVTVVKAFNISQENIAEVTTAVNVSNNVCHRCAQCFYSEKTYNVHILICDNSSDVITYICSYCGEILNNKTKFTAHITGCSLKNEDAPDDGNYNCCPHCKECFDSECEYNNHIQICRTYNGIYTCEYCSADFKTEAALSEHLLICKENPDNSYTCPYCDKTFDNGDSYNNHISVCPDKPVDYICEYCGKIFTAIYQYNSHMSSCSEKKKIIELKIYSMPTKTSYEYKSADSPELSGFSIFATYKDGTSEIITDVSKMNVTGFTSSSVGSKNINVEYGGKAVTFNIEVYYAWWQILIRILLLGFLWY